MPDPTIELVSINTLKPNARNARTHSRAQIRGIARSIDRFGFLAPILADETRTILAGHGRYEAAKRLGLKELPVRFVDHLSDAEKRAYMLADNRIAEAAGWDRDLLAVELGELVELDFEVELTGFSVPEIDLIIEEAAAKTNDAPAEPEERLEVPAVPVSRPGDLWQLGPHRLFCGSALDAAAYEALLGGQAASAVFTDSPYNVPIAGHVSGLGKVKHRDFACAVGEMSRDAFTDFLATALGHAASCSEPGAVHFVCMDWRHVGELEAAGRSVYGEFLNICVWDKVTAGMGSLYRSRHELVFVYRVGAEPHRNNVDLGRHGRNRTNVWSYRGMAGFAKDRDATLKLHPTVKPITMVADALLDVTKRGDLVLDPFSGSGTTLLACEKVGRRAAVIELDPGYVDVACQRFLKMTGRTATLAETREGFDVVAERRFDEAADLAARKSKDANLKMESA